MTLAVPEVVLAARRRVEVFLGGGPGSAIRSFWEWLANLGQQGKQVKPGYEHHCVCLVWIRLSGESCCSCQNLLDPGSERPLTGVSIARLFACFCLATCACHKPSGPPPAPQGPSRAIASPRGDPSNGETREYRITTFQGWDSSPPPPQNLKSLCMGKLQSCVVSHHKQFRYRKV